MSVQLDVAKLEEIRLELGDEAAEKYFAYINTLGPEKLFKMGLSALPEGEGWRSGYTKPTVAARTAKRRAKNRASRTARAAQRRNH